jgi:DNA-directed RNA polymerase specialized sigma24 family protein
MYASRNDFCKLFLEDTNSLYLLSYLLTSNQEKARQCFVAGLDDCVDRNSVFHRWVHTWARRVIVRNAIRVTAPRPGLAKATPNAPKTRVQSELLRMPAHDNGFERFVFILSVLERYSDKDCTLLLDVSIQEVREARTRAEKHIAEFVKRDVESPDILAQCHKVKRQQ